MFLPGAGGESQTRVGVSLSTVEEPNGRHADSSVVCDQTPEQPWAPERKKTITQDCERKLPKETDREMEDVGGSVGERGELHLC